MPDQRRQRRVFGVLLDDLHLGYQETVLSGSIAYCRKHDIDLLCFVTGHLLPGNQVDHGKNILFNLVEESFVAGLIVVTTSLENVVGKNTFIDFLSRYYPIPLVSIGEIIPEYPSLTIDNEKGLTDLLNHLADVHGYKRLAFIAGPQVNSESQIRFQAYRDFLAARGWPYLSELVAEGRFTAMTGRRAVAELLDRRKVNFDVIVAANDLMAFGAIEELTARGISVPGEAFVVGFDDMANSKNASLTTIRQPLYQQGYLAVRTLVDLLEKKTTATEIKLPTELVVRESCGCLSPSLTACETWTTSDAAGGRPDQSALVSGLDQTAWGARLPSSPASRDWLARLSASLTEAYDRKQALVFIKAWDAVIFEAKARALPLSALQEIISVLRGVLVPLRGEEPRWRFYEDNFHRARIMLEAAVRKEESALRTVASITEMKLDILGNKMSATGNVDELFELIGFELPLLGVGSCYLSLFEPGMEKARLVFAYDENGRIALPGGGIVFPAKSLFPAAVPRPDRWQCLVVHILNHQDRDLGFILLEMGDEVERAAVIEFLRTKIGITLQSLILIREITSQSFRLEQFNRNLEQSNRALQEFAYVASHDLQEPLRKISTFGERLERLASRPEAALGEQGLDYLTRMRNAANRMQKLIESLLSYSRVTTLGKPFVTVDLNLIVRDVLSDLEVQLEKTGGRVEIGALPVLEADPLQIRQLFQNLIGNALKFQKPGTRPVVRVIPRPAERGEGPVLAVADNGIGIDPRYHEKIFGVFQRLHGREEYEGSGIGLAICKKIMERHGGAIGVENGPGGGTAFILRFGPTAKST